jgi:hypothetical protein
MKDTIKNSIIGTFSIFGLVALISSSNNVPTVIHEGSNTPESHVWEMIVTHGTNTTDGRCWLYNKVTGETRKFARGWPGVKGVTDRVEKCSYIKITEIK